MIRTQEDFKNIVYECLGELSALNVASDNMTEKLCDIEIESFNNELSEDVMLDAIMFAHEAIKQLCDFEIEIAKEIGKEKRVERKKYEIQCGEHISCSIILVYLLVYGICKKIQKNSTLSLKGLQIICLNW